MTYLVTGGAGFIGSNIARALLAEGHTVRVVDNLSTGLRENIPDGCVFHEVDLRDLDALKSAFVGVDGVFHEAALARVQPSIENPLETNDVNINGTLNVIMAARDAGVKRIVYAASSSAYGDATEFPLREEMTPNPLSPYGLQKYVGEEYMKLASIFWNIETVSLRYFNVYGPGLNFTGAYKLVMAVFLEQRKKGDQLTITGDGTQTRDFTYIDDVVRANLLAMQSAQVGKGEVMNIGAGDNHSVNEVAENIGGTAIHIAPRVEPHDTLADNAKAKRLIGWSPAVAFDDGMRRTVAWYDAQQK